MSKSSIEITDNAYLITLNKAEFEYPMVRALLTRLFSGALLQEEAYSNEEDFASKYASELGERFDFLADK
ncbi:hypothetical protein [Parapedobacter sp. DT-150]|uniref:hypothetical protein n=1 Tax=Parapedobacter sp. DT-150 TaxID=3396162 RepID=UPI003F1B1544